MSNVINRIYLLNEAFRNKRGDHMLAQSGDPQTLQSSLSQAKNIFHEFCELLVAFGYNKKQIEHMRDTFDVDLRMVPMDGSVDLTKIRDSLCDIDVFSIGTHFKLGFSAEEDLNAVVDQVMTRFIKDEADKVATINMHAAKGVKDVYFEGEYPNGVLKSNSDQPDAPAGKFLKSASAQKDPKFVQVPSSV